MRLIKYILNTVTKQDKPKLLGRWRVKSDVENWMLNYHPEPGYQNNKKQEWIKKMNCNK